MVVNGIDVTVNGINDMTEQEIMGYIDMLQEDTDGSSAACAFLQLQMARLTWTMSCSLQSLSASAASLAIW